MWHYEKNRQPRGPISQEGVEGLIQQGEIGPGTLVWRDGMNRWQRADQTELSEIFGNEVIVPRPGSSKASSPFPGRSESESLRAELSAGATQPRLEGRIDTSGTDHTAGYPIHLTRFFQGGLALLGLTQAGLLFSLTFQVGVVASFHEGTLRPARRVEFFAELADMMVMIGGRGSLALTLPVILIAIIWVCRMTHVARALDADVRLTPRIVVISLLFPFANVVVPCLALNRIWRAGGTLYSDGTDSRTWIPAALAGLLMVSCPVGLTGYVLSTAASETGLIFAGSILSALAVFGYLATSLLALLLVGRIGRRFSPLLEGNFPSGLRLREPLGTP